MRVRRAAAADWVGQARVPAAWPGHLACQSALQQAASGRSEGGSHAKLPKGMVRVEGRRAMWPPSAAVEVGWAPAPDLMLRYWLLHLCSC